ncbi:unannotated protein [freshwater metagenome]|uniref:Unannotated protein n=1 Tax=freshwater metagenome TaxID=449393 RepID=A0A6J6H4N4_9ZZZZ
MPPSASGVPPPSVTVTAAAAPLLKLTTLPLPTVCAVAWKLEAKDRSAAFVALA